MENKLKFDKKRTKAKFCPCGKSNKDGKFIPFVGFEDKGYCHSCGKTFFPDGNNQPLERYTPPQVHTPPTTPDYHSHELFNQSLRNYDSNTFVTFLKTIFPVDKVDELCSTYQIGTSKHWGGSTIFWQADESGNFHAGRIMAYNPTTGKRVKEPFSHVTWVHKVLSMDSFVLNQCLFGLHLANLFPDRTIGIVESEKTAIIASGYLPNILWLATGGKQNLKPDKFKPLAGRKVILFPDGNAFDEWVTIMESIKKKLPSIRLTISDLLQQHATPEDRKAGFDLADYLIKTKPPKPPLPPTENPIQETKPPLPPKPPTPSTPEFIKICLQVKAGKPIHEAAAGWNITDGSRAQLEYLETLAKFSNFEKNKYLQN
jgi:hypothetical protein